MTYTKLEMPVVRSMAELGESHDLDAALTARYWGKPTTLVRAFAGEAAGTRVRVVGFVNSGFLGQRVNIRTEDGRSLGLAPQDALDADALLA